MVHCTSWWILGIRKIHLLFEKNPSSVWTARGIRSKKFILPFGTAWTIDSKKKKVWAVRDSSYPIMKKIILAIVRTPKHFPSSLNDTCCRVLYITQIVITFLFQVYPHLKWHSVHCLREKTFDSQASNQKPFILAASFNAHQTMMFIWTVDKVYFDSWKTFLQLPKLHTQLW